MVLPFLLKEVRDGRLVAVVLGLEGGEIRRRFGSGAHVLERAARVDAPCDEPHQRLVHLHQLIALIEIGRVRDGPARGDRENEPGQHDPGSKESRGLFDRDERQRPQHEQGGEYDTD